MADPGDLSWWFGNQGKQPGDYQQQSQFQDRNQINGVIQQGLQQANTRGAPQAQASSPYSGMQMQQAQNLQRIANGQAPGAGELAVNRQFQTGIANAQGMANMNRGANAGIGALAGARGVVDMTGNAAGQARQAAMGDQMNANQMLTGAMGQARGQDQQMQLANLDAQLRSQGMNDAQRIAMLQQLTGMDAAQLQAMTGMYAGGQSDKGMLGGLLSAGGTVLGGYLSRPQAPVQSDERLKKDIAPAGQFVDAMLDSLKPYTYAYKDEKHGKGPRAGIMAQDLERSELGKQIVYEAPDGKALDVNKALSAALAGMARLNERTRSLEAKG